MSKTQFDDLARRDILIEPDAQQLQVLQEEWFWELRYPNLLEHLASSFTPQMSVAELCQLLSREGKARHQNLFELFLNPPKSNEDLNDVIQTVLGRSLKSPAISELRTQYINPSNRLVVLEINPVSFWKGFGIGVLPTVLPEQNDETLFMNVLEARTVDGYRENLSALLLLNHLLPQTREAMVQPFSQALSDQNSLYDLRDLALNKMELILALFNYHRLLRYKGERVVAQKYCLELAQFLLMQVVRIKSWHNQATKLVDQNDQEALTQLSQMISAGIQQDNESMSRIHRTYRAQLLAETSFTEQDLSVFDQGMMLFHQREEEEFDLLNQERSEEIVPKKQCSRWTFKPDVNILKFYYALIDIPPTHELSVILNTVCDGPISDEEAACFKQDLLLNLVEDTEVRVLLRSAAALQPGGRLQAVNDERTQDAIFRFNQVLKTKRFPVQLVELQQYLEEYFGMSREIFLSSTIWGEQCAAEFQALLKQNPTVRFAQALELKRGLDYALRDFSEADRNLLPLDIVSRAWFLLNEEHLPEDLPLVERGVVAIPREYQRLFYSRFWQTTQFSEYQENQEYHSDFHGFKLLNTVLDTVAKAALRQQKRFELYYSTVIPLLLERKNEEHADRFQRLMESRLKQLRNILALAHEIREGMEGYHESDFEAWGTIDTVEKHRYHDKINQLREALDQYHHGLESAFEWEPQHIRPRALQSVKQHRKTVFTHDAPQDLVVPDSVGVWGTVWGMLVSIWESIRNFFRAVTPASTADIDQKLHVEDSSLVAREKWRIAFNAFFNAKLAFLQSSTPEHRATLVQAIQILRDEVDANNQNRTGLGKETINLLNNTIDGLTREIKNTLRRSRQITPQERQELCHQLENQIEFLKAALLNNLQQLSSEGPEESVESKHVEQCVYDVVKRTTHVVQQPAPTLSEKEHAELLHLSHEIQYLTANLVQVESLTHDIFEKEQEQTAHLAALSQRWSLLLQEVVEQKTFDSERLFEIQQLVTEFGCEIERVLKTNFGSLEITRKALHPLRENVRASAQFLGLKYETCDVRSVRQEAKTDFSKEDEQKHYSTN